MTADPVVPVNDAGQLRTRLAGSVADVARLFTLREHLITAAWDAGIGIKSIRDTAQIPTARTVDDIVKEYAEKQREVMFAATAELWKTGQVIQDRYGLRWRADTNMSSRERGWFCRSVGLKVFLTGTRMAERGPLTLIRQDRVFAGETGSAERLAAVAARKAGEVEDQAVTVTPVEDPEWIPVRFPVLAVEGLTTTDGRIVDAGAIVAGHFPMPLRARRHGQTVPVGRIDTLNRTVGAVLTRDGTPFPTSVAVWSGTGAIHGFTLTEVEDMTREFAPEIDLSEVELSDSEVDGFTRITSGVLTSVVLGDSPAFTDAYWTVAS
jgi:hypothetical protein